MIQKFSAQTKSFIVLLIVALAGSLFTVLYQNMSPNGSGGYTAENSIDATFYGERDLNRTKTADAAQTPASEPAPAIDTSTWKEYKDATYPFSFKYDPKWSVKKTAASGGYYRIDIDPGARYDNMKVFVSERDFYVMNNLPTKEETLGENVVINALDMLYGIKKDRYFFTFDLGSSVSLQPYFQELVKSVRIAE